ncbi:hypothetical protein SprV_0100057100 [Sparganum proliferum]
MSKAFLRSTKLEYRGGGPHLLVLLLQLTGGEDHVRGPAMTAKAALAFWQKTLFQMITQTVEKDASEDLSSDIQQNDASMIVAELMLSFPLV